MPTLAKTAEAGLATSSLDDLPISLQGFLESFERTSEPPGR